jgi:membrane carboxypeptidase/penicillin-binding protein
MATLLLDGKQLGKVACVFHPSNGGKHKIGRSQSRQTWAKSKALISKITRARWAGVEAKVVEYLTSKGEALSSNPSTAKMCLGVKADKP